MSVVRFAAPLLLACCSAALVGQESLADEVQALVDRVLQGDRPVESADELWQSACAAHGEIGPLEQALRERLQSRNGTEVARLLCAVLRYEGRPADGLAALDRIAERERTDADFLLRAELLDTLGRGEEAARAYDALLQRELDPKLHRRILFRRALVGSDSIKQLKRFAARADSDREQRNQAAIILALRDEPQAALDLYEVHGEGTQRFRQLVRLAEWAIAANQFERAQQFAWAAVDCAKMRRDRRYALTVVVSACRAGGLIDQLLQRFEQAENLGQDARQVWIDLLRDEGRVEDALRLFRAEGDGQWTPALRRQLLEICRETGRADVLVAQFRALIAQEPANLEWRSGLSRHFLENGQREPAREVWADFGNAVTAPGAHLDAARALMELGLDGPALRHAAVAAESESLREQAQLFAVKLYVARGDFEDAVRELEAIEAAAQGTDAVLAEIAGIYERIDRLDRSVAVLDRMRAAHGDFLGTDLEMKYALLLSKVDREADALVVWRSLWKRVRSTPRGRYVEDRMMTVAARLGVLAKIAIELEDKLDAGTADPVDVELLVRLYVKVGDSAAATEITEQALEGSGAADLEVIRKKATIYLACHDYPEYEKLIEQLIVRDPDNRLDHMRELTLSRLERGRRAQAIEELPKLRAASTDGGIADEFEAGIYQLAGLNERALKSYTKGLGRYPDRIDTHLLVANLMRETGREMEAARRFQYLAATAERDDLFTIAIDGILNLRAQNGTQVPDDVVDWAMRVTLERLAERSHRFYLHRLAADLAEERSDMPMSIRTLTAGIPVAGERRTALLREILGKLRSLDKSARTMFGGRRAMKISKSWDPEPYVRIGRRLLGQGEVVPPQVFMDLAAVFLHVDAVPDAMRTFSRAAELLDRAEVHRQAAAVLEDGKRYDAALRFYRRLLSVDAGDVGLLAKIGRLEELAGRDDAAVVVYRQGLATALRQTKTRVHLAVEEEPDPDDLAAIYGGQRNVDALAAALPRFVEGLLVTLESSDAPALLEQLRVGVEQDLAAIGGVTAEGEPAIDTFPRLNARAEALRRLAIAFGHGAVSERVDAKLLQRFPTDRDLAKATIAFRADRGFHLAAARLAKGSRFVSDPDFASVVLDENLAVGVSPAVAAARVLPLLVEDPAGLRAMLDEVDTAALDARSLGCVPTLLGACAAVGAHDAGERLARAAVRISAGFSQRQRVQNRTGAAAYLRLAARIDAELEDRLWQYRIDRSAANGPKALVDLQYEVGDRTFEIDPDRIERMLRSEVGNSAQERYGLRSMSLLQFLPADRRAPLVRELYTAAPRSQRLTVLSTGADYLVDPLTDGFVEWYAGTFAREYAGADASKRRVAGGGYVRNPDASLRLTRVRLETALAAGGSHREWLRLLELVCQLGDREGAERVLDEGVPDMIARDDLARIVPNRPKGLDTRQIDTTVDKVVRLGLQDVAGRIVRRKLKQRPRHAALRYLNWQLRTREAGASQFVDEQVAANPDDVELLDRVAKFQRGRGRLVEAADTLQRLAGLGGKRAATWKRQLAALRRQLRNEPAKPSRKPSRSTARVASSLVSAAVISNVAASGRGLGRIPELAKEEDQKKAAREFRGIWRSEPRTRVVISPFGRRANVTLSPGALEPLRGKPFAVAEARRVLRLLVDAGQLDSDGLLPALLQVMATEHDLTGEAEALLEALAEGRGGAVEAIALQMMLGDKGLDDGLQERIVEVLLRRRETPDRTRLRGIADHLVGTDQREAAARLYRLATLVHTAPRYFTPSSDRSSKPEAELAAMRERLGGELGRRTAVLWLDDRLAVRPSYAVMLAAVRAWPDLVPAEELPQRIDDLRARVLEMRSGRYAGLRNDDATGLSAEICQSLLRAGRFETAVEEFAELVRSPDADLYGRIPRRNQKVATEHAKKLVELEIDGRTTWLRMVGEAIVAWHEQRRLADPEIVLGVLGRAFAQAGADGVAEALADALEKLSPDDSRAEQQLAKLRRAMGDQVAAAAIERRLLRMRRLAIADHGRVLRELRETDGADAAFAAGERTLEYTADSDVLRAMIEFADELGRSERAAEWRGALEKRARTKREGANKAKRTAGRSGRK